MKMIYTYQLTKDQRRLIDAVVDAGLATRGHAMKLFERHEQLVTAAWRHALEARSTPTTTPATDPAPEHPPYIDRPEQLELFILEAR